MHMVRFLWGLIALPLALAVAGCSLARMPQAAVPSHTISPISTVDAVATPMHLRIPAIGVDTRIEPVGILSNGDMATPMQHPWEDVGWYNDGPRPGERNSAVIDGHLDRPGGLPAVFWHLRELHVNDNVLVLDSTGNTLSFRVTRIALYAPQDAPIQDIFGNRGGRYLNLITCAGDWIASQHQTTLRLVVYTTLVQ